MVVSDALELPSFDGATIVAGEAGLNNEITSAMILEAADIQHWGKRGQLIISSFFALQHLTELDVAKFFRTMSTIGICGLAFKPERLLKDPPQQIIELCNDFDIPLILLAPTITYEAILLDVLGNVLDSNITLLNKYYDAHQQAMSLSMKQPSITEVLSSLRNIIQTDVTYLDGQKDRRIGTNMEKTTFSSYSFKRRDPGPFETHAYYDVKLNYDGARGKTGDKNVREAIAVRIPSNDNHGQYLIVHFDSRILRALDSMVIENFVNLMQIELMRGSTIKQRLFFQNNNVVHDILLNRISSSDRLETALTQLGVNQYPNYEILLIKTNLVDSLDLDRLDELHANIKQRVRILYPNCAYFISGERIVFLHNVRSPQSAINLNQIVDLLVEIQNSSMLAPFTYLAAQSEMTTKDKIPLINTQVMKIYDLFDNSSAENVALNYKDLGIYKLLLKTDNLSKLESFADQRLLHMHREDPELFETLLALATNNMNYQQTAEQLFVHPKTVRYRMSNIESKYGIDIRDSDDYLQVVFTGKILKLVQSTTSLD